MAYPARPDRSTPRNGNGSPHRGTNGGGTNGSSGHSPGAKIAIARAISRKPANRGGVLGLISIMLVLLLVAVIGGSVVAVGSGTAALFSQLEAGLPDVQQFEQLTFAEPTTVWDRTGTQRLATFQLEQRHVVTYDQIPQLVLDATTATEDHTFWTNEGYDLNAIFSSINAQLSDNGGRGGASTITQQLVRARLLPPELLAPGSDVYLRKAKEIIQSYKLTQAFPGEQGKERIITAYLNQIFYGHNAYGIAAAARVYFGENLDQLTPAQAALLAGLPQSPSVLDPYRYAKPNGKGKFVVPTCGADPAPDCVDPAPVARRNLVLDQLAKGFGRWTTLTPQQLIEAKNEPIVLVGDKPTLFQAPQFIWAMKQRLDQIVSDRAPVESGGYRVITTLDKNAQRIAEKWVTAATVLPQLSYSAYYRALRADKIGSSDRTWINLLRNKGIHNGALVALDYRTGDVLAYVGSANYYGKNSKKMDPKYDVAGLGYRQPGSAWKPVLYASGFDEHAVTPGTVLLDVTTNFYGSWVPQDADNLERGPVLVRKALQYSLNIPAIRAMDRIGPAVVGQYAARAGITFIAGRKAMERANLAGAIGTVEVHLIDLVAAYGAFGNGGKVTDPRYILKVYDTNGKQIFDAGKPVFKQAWSAPAAWLIGNILSGNTDPKQNTIWGPRFMLTNGPGGSYRPAAVKTGTTNDIKDLSTYGFLPKPNDPTDPNLHAVALGVWMGNSDHSAPTLGNAEIFATDGPGMVWHSFMRDYMAGKPTAQFDPPPKGIVQKTIDSFTGGVPGPWTKDTTVEYFIQGTEPGSKNAVDPPHEMYAQACGQWVVDPVKAENPGAPSGWRAADRDWASRAQKGQYVYGRYHTGTAYFWGRSSWGGIISVNGTCAAPTPSPGASTGPTATPGDTPKPGHTPKPTPEPTPKPHKTPQPTPTPEVTPKPHKTPKPLQGATPDAPVAVVADAPKSGPDPEDVALSKIVTQGLVNGVDVATEADLAARQGEGLADTGSGDDHLPWTPTGQVLPAIVPDQLATQPIRVGRRRRRLSRTLRPLPQH